MEQKVAAEQNIFVVDRKLKKTCPQADVEVNGHVLNFCESDFISLNTNL